MELAKDGIGYARSVHELMAEPTLAMALTRSASAVTMVAKWAEAGCPAEVVGLILNGSEFIAAPPPFWPWKLWSSEELIDSVAGVQGILSSSTCFRRCPNQWVTRSAPDWLTDPYHTLRPAWPEGM